MPVAASLLEAESHLSNPGLDALVLDVGLPPRPQVLVDLGRELGHEDPDLNRVARCVASDVALTAAMLKLANSPAYGSGRRIETLGQALSMLGLKQVSVMVTALVMRKVLRTDGPQLTRFWDVSAKRSWALATLARSLKGVDVDVAQTFGLFCDVGIPLLMQRFSDYTRVLQAANVDTERSFTQVEQSHLQTDHALIGALMARSWGVSQTVCLAIRLHHDYAVFRDPNVPEAVSRLMAMGLIAEAAIQQFARLNTSTEWTKGGEAAMGALTLSEHDVHDLLEQLVDGFSAGTA
jgi:HD-like signal output (HDOD) protein